MVKVLISDNLSPRAAEIFREQGIEVDVKTGMKPDELRACIGEYDGLAVRSATKVTSEILQATDRLKIIGRAGIGVDNIDVPAATGRGVVVMNTPLGNSITTAEHAIAMMLSLARQIPAADRSTRDSRWEKSRFMGVELTAKTLGVIGCGNIGSIVADRAHGLHMKVIAFDPFLSPERATDLGVEKVELDDLLARADFITLHTPMTEQTKGLIDDEALKKTKKGVRIINCARGGLVVEEDLYEAIKSGHVAGAALDVFTVEPAKDNPLFELEEVVTTPHLGAATSEAQENVALQIAEQMAGYLLHGAVSNAVNMPSLSAEDAPRLKPYMVLAENLGSFAGQLTETAIEEIRIEYEGHVAELNTRPLTAILLKGLLSPLLDAVNMVNAPVLARERDIRVSETKIDGPTDYQTLIRLTVVTERRERSVAGTLFGGTRARIVEVQDIRFEAELGPDMIFIRNQDRPGFIGKLGTTLGNAGVNIANFHLGRSHRGRGAIALVEVDGPCTDEVIQDLTKLPDVLQVKPLRF